MDVGPPLKQKLSAISGQLILKAEAEPKFLKESLGLGTILALR
jgi:hypothetical protein